MGLVLEDAQSPQPSSESSAAPGAKRSPAGATRTMSHAQGQRHLSPNVRGSALVAAGCQTTEESHNNGLTARLLEQLNQHPDQGLDDAIANARVRVGKQYADQHATVTTAGNHAERAKGGGRKHAVFIANANYADSGRLHPLPSTVGEATAMESALAARGYTSHGVHVDQTAQQMRQEAAVTALGTGVGAGDHVVIHYGGHGVPRGLVGRTMDTFAVARATSAADSTIPGQASIKTASDVLTPNLVPGLDPNDYLPYETIESIARSAVGKGVHVSLILDACSSGMAADLVRSRRDYAPDGGTQDVQAGDANAVASAPVVSGAETAIGTKLALVGIVRAWNGDRHAARLEDDESTKAARLAEIDARYLAALQSVWQEFIAARLAALEQEMRARACFLGAAPPAPSAMGSLANVLTWLDQAYEALNNT